MYRFVFGRLCGAPFALVLLMGSSAANLALATDFPVTGSIIVNGEQGELPPNGVFAHSGYDPGDGLIDAGTFTFPVTTETSVSDGIVFVLKYQMIQTDSSNGAVATDGVAALSTATFKLTILSITAGGVPIPIGQCTIEPIAVDLAGTASAEGLDLADEQFDIPEVPPGQCGSFRGSLNDAFFGPNNSMNLLLAGDFTPPPKTDLIFKNGFDNP